MSAERAGKIVGVTAGVLICVGLGAGAHAAATYSSEPTVTAKITDVTVKPQVAAKPDKNAKSWVDAFGRACTQVNPPKAAIALDCDYPPATDAAEPPFKPSTYTQETSNAAVVDVPSTAPDQGTQGSGAGVEGLAGTVGQGHAGNDRPVAQSSAGRAQAEASAAGSRTAKDAAVAPVVEGRARAVNPNPPIATPTSAPAVVHSTPEVTLIPPVVYPCPEEDPESCAPQPETTPVPTVTRQERAVNPTPTFEETTFP